MTEITTKALDRRLYVGRKSPHQQPLGTKRPGVHEREIAEHKRRLAEWEDLLACETDPSERAQIMGSIDGLRLAIQDMEREGSCES